MLSLIKETIYDVISGKVPVRHGETIQAAARYLGGGPKASIRIENPKQYKDEEAARLTVFCAERQLWIDAVDFSRFVSEGAEQRLDLILYRHRFFSFNGLMVKK